MEPHLEDNSPGTAVEPEDDDSDDSIPPMPPVPQAIPRKASRSRVRRAYPKDYSSDPQTYNHPPRRPKQPRFQDDSFDDTQGSDRAWREEVRHPDVNERRYTTRIRGGPPRSYLNQRNSILLEQQNAPNKPWIEETRGQYVDPFSPRHPPPRWYYDEEHGYSQFPTRGYYSSDSPRIQWNDLTKEQKAEVMRLPWSEWMNSDVKNHFVASLGEFVGTTMFLFFAFAGTGVANIQSQANNSSESSSSNSVSCSPGAGSMTGF